jgi:hypothetical protein
MLYKFKNLEMKDRIEFGKKEKLCFNCLKTGHLSSNCRAFPNCVFGGCKLKHHSLFHFTQTKSSNPESHSESKPLSVPDSSSGSKGGSQLTGAGTSHGAGAKMTSAHILLNPNPICLGILTVKIKAKGGTRSVEGYAYLDIGSSGTVFLESLVKLGAEATPTILNCETMNATTSEECVTLDLRIENLDGSGFVECTGYSRKDLSVGNKSIPKKEQIQKFGHRKKVLLPRTNREKSADPDRYRRSRSSLSLKGIERCKEGTLCPQECPWMDHTWTIRQSLTNCKKFLPYSDPASPIVRSFYHIHIQMMP